MAYKPPRFGQPSMMSYGSSGPRFSPAPRQSAPFPSLSGGRLQSYGPSFGALGRAPTIRRQTTPAPAARAPTPQASAPSLVDQLKATLGQKQGAATPKTISYDHTTDPIMQQIAALGTQSRQGAESQALALRKQTAIDYGDENIARALGDETTALAAKNNPNSVRAQLQKSYDDAVREAEQGYSDQNLFYGGARIKGLQDLATQLSTQQAQAAGEQQKTLGTIEQQRLAAIAAADAADLQAQQEAEQRAAYAAMMAGYGDMEDIDWSQFAGLDSGDVGGEGPTITAPSVGTRPMPLQTPAGGYRLPARLQAGPSSLPYDIRRATPPPRPAAPKPAKAPASKPAPKAPAAPKAAAKPAAKKKK